MFNREVSLMIFQKFWKHILSQSFEKYIKKIVGKKQKSWYIENESNFLEYSIPPLSSVRDKKTA